MLFLLKLSVKLSVELSPWSLFLDLSFDLSILSTLSWLLSIPSSSLKFSVNFLDPLEPDSTLYRVLREQESTGLIVDRTSPWIWTLVYVLLTSSMDWGWLRVTNWTTHYHSDSSLIIFYLNMVDYPIPCSYNMTWDTFLIILGTQGWYLSHVLPFRQS